MSYGVRTLTATFTKVDIRRVFEAVEATVRMAVSRTGLNSAKWATEVSADLRHLAESEALDKAHLILNDARGTELKALVFEPSNAALGWQDERPRANRWPYQPSGRLFVVVEHTTEFKDLLEHQQSKVMDGCILNWEPTSVDVSHSGLTPTRQQHYASNGYGVRTTDYT